MTLLLNVKNCCCDDRKNKIKIICVALILSKHESDRVSPQKAEKHQFYDM